MPEAREPEPTPADPTPAPQDPTGVDVSEVLEKLSGIHGESQLQYAAALVKIDKLTAVIQQLQAELVAKCPPPE